MKDLLVFLDNWNHGTLYQVESILLRTYLFDNLKAKVTQAVSGVNFFSFTTDVWMTNVSNESLLSLTAHWITGTSRTCSCIAEKITGMLRSWDISHDQVHVILCDNGSNMVRAMKDACLPSLGCFAQTLQLVVHEGVLSQRAVIDILAICRKIVGHFKHSSLAYSRLREIQNNLSLSPHHLKQDKPTR